MDVEKLRAYLAPRIEDHDFSKLEIQQFRHGQSNPTYLLHTANGCLVLRKQPPGKLLRGAHQVDREYEAITALRGLLPVPKTRLLCQDLDVVGTQFFVYDFIEGRLFKDITLPDVSKATRKDIYFAMADTLAA